MKLYNLRAHRTVWSLALEPAFLDLALRFFDALKVL